MYFYNFNYLSFIIFNIFTVVVNVWYINIICIYIDLKKRTVFLHDFNIILFNFYV